MAEVRNLKAVVEYDGTAYAGWQIQDNGLSIQEVLQSKIAILVDAPVKVVGSGRTDAGVHALGQVFNVKAAFPFDNQRFVHSLNKLLPRDITLLSAVDVPMEFNAVRDSTWKRYRYHIYTGDQPRAMLSRTSWHIRYPLDIKKMKKAMKMLEGKHDFLSFKGKKSSAKTSTRNIISTSLVKDGDGMITFEIVGEGFLKGMVRIIVGTLFEIGRGFFEVEDMKRIMDAKDRKVAGPTAPARGLFMVEAGYK